MSSAAPRVIVILTGQYWIAHSVNDTSPTPIASPGRASLEAALNPEEGDWFYYVLTEENGPGTHTFAVTAEDFNAAVQICIERDLGCG